MLEGSAEAAEEVEKTAAGVAYSERAEAGRAHLATGVEPAAEAAAGAAVAAVAAETSMDSIETRGT